MYKLAIITVFAYALTTIASSLINLDISSSTAILSVLTTTVATEVALYLGA